MGKYQTISVEVGKIKDWLWDRDIPEEHREELGKSIKDIGLQQLPIVRPHPKYKGFYQGLAGHSRVKASGLKPTDKIEVRFRPDISDAEALRIAWDTNIMKSPSRMQKAEFLEQCLKTGVAKNQAHLSKILGIAESTIADYLPLVKNPVFREIAEKFPNRQINREIQRVVMAVPENRQKSVAKKLMKETDPEKIIKAREVENRIALLNQKAQAIREKIAGYEIRLREHEKKAKEYPNLKKRKEQLEKQLKSLTAKAVKSKDKEYRGLKQRILEITEKYQPLLNDLKAKEEKLRDLKKDLSSMRVDVSLYQQIQDKLSEYKKKITNIDVQIEKLKVQKAELVNAMNKLLKDNEGLTNDFKAKEDKENEIAKCEAEIQKIKDKIARYEKQYGHTIRNFDKEKARLEKHDAQFTELHEQIKKLHAEHSEVLAMFNSAKKSPKEIEKYRDKIANAQIEIASIEKEIEELSKSY